MQTAVKAPLVIVLSVLVGIGMANAFEIAGGVSFVLPFVAMTAAGLAVGYFFGRHDRTQPAAGVEPGPVTAPMSELIPYPEDRQQAA